MNNKTKSCREGDILARKNSKGNDSWVGNAKALTGEGDSCQCDQGEGVTRAEEDRRLRGGEQTD